MNTYNDVAESLLLLLSLGATACVTPRGHFYEVHIDPSEFSEAQRAMAVDGVRMWEATNIQVSFDIEIGPCSGIHDHMACIHGVTLYELYTQHGGEHLGDTDSWVGIDGGESWIPVNPPHFCNDTCFRALVAHELGHAMIGWDHLRWPGALMSSEMGTLQMTKEDADYWVQTRTED